MQLKCYSCHAPFSVSKEIIHIALDKMAKKDWKHYDFSCPQCKKANRASKEQLLHAAPNWEQEADE